MAAIVTLERRPSVLPRVLLTYALLATVLIALFLTLSGVGSTTAGTRPTPHPQTGPPRTVETPISSEGREEYTMWRGEQ